MQPIYFQKPIVWGKRLGPVFIDFVTVNMESVEFTLGCKVYYLFYLQVTGL